MSMSTEETKVLAKLRNRSTGSFDRLKDQEARAGGRRLPGGIEEGTAIITGAKLGESQKVVIPTFTYTLLLRLLKSVRVFLAESSIC